VAEKKGGGRVFITCIIIYIIYTEAFFMRIKGASWMCSLDRLLCCAPPKFSWGTPAGV